MAEDRKLQLIIKDHNCARVGEVASYESFVSVERVNDVGEATLVAGFGASDENDRVLDSLRERHPHYFRRAVEISVTVSPPAVRFLADSVDYLLGKGPWPGDIRW